MPKGKISISITGSANIYANLDNSSCERHLFYMDGRQGSQPFELDFWPDVIFNEISDPDSHPTALERCIKFIQTQGKPVINHPRKIMQTTRDAIARSLVDIPGLKMPRTIRLNPSSPADVAAAISESNLAFPLIFRQAGDHGGVSTNLLNHGSEIEQAMYSYPLDGRAFYATEFVDYASVADGLYRKYRLVVVGQQVFLRHMIISDQWLIHSNSRSFMQDKIELQNEELQALKTFSTVIGPKIIKSIGQITEKLKLDYFGIDCNINEDGEILAFEINANMNILINSEPSPNRWESPIAAIKKALEQLIVRRAAV